MVLNLSVRNKYMSKSVMRGFCALVAIAIVAICVYVLSNKQMVSYWYQDRLRDETSYTLFLGSSSIARLPENKVTQCEPTVIYGFENGVAEDIQTYLKFAKLQNVERIILYIGENDIAHGEAFSVTLSQVNEIITELLEFPELNISLMTIKPSPRRARFHSEFIQFNQSLEEYWSKSGILKNQGGRLSFIPFHLIDRPVYYSQDGIHLNNAGYNALSLMINDACTNL